MRLIDADDLEFNLRNTDVECLKDVFNILKMSKTIKPKELEWDSSLKRCPFCGGEAEFCRVKPTNGNVCINVKCCVCGCQTKLFSDSNDRYAIKRNGKPYRNSAKIWNSRINTEKTE